MDRTLVLRFDARILVLVGVLLVMIAASLPWTNLPSFLAGDLARQGIDSGGLITLGLAVLAAASLLLPWHPLRRVSLPAAILAVLTDFVALLALIRVVQLASTLQMSLSAQLSSVGSGLYLTFAGVLLMVIGGLTGVKPPASHATLAPSTMWDSRWVRFAAWLALISALLASCLCAWGIGLLVRPYTLGPGQAKASPTFVPAPTTYLATPLVDVQLAPLGSVPTVPAPLPTTIRPVTNPPATATLPPLPASPTPRRSPTTPMPSPTPPLVPTLPVVGAPTATPTFTPTSTATFTLTPTPPTSPLGTPTPTRTPTPTPTTTPAD
jgi:hypothetical protein